VPDHTALADAFFAAVAGCDVAAAGALCSPEARFWSSDRAQWTPMVDQLSGLLSALTAIGGSISYTDTITTVIDDGFVVEHVANVSLGADRSAAMPVAAIGRVSDGVIVELKEYFDPSPLARAMAGSGA
jgi:ketosteroid isomerase-like protein